MSCSQCLNSILGSCANCQLNALQSNQSWQSWQLPVQNTAVAQSLMGINRTASSTRLPRLTVEDHIGNLITEMTIAAEQELINSYSELIRGFDQPLMTKEEFIKLKFIDKLSEETIQEMIKDKLIKFIKLKVFK